MYQCGGVLGAKEVGVWRRTASWNHGRGSGGRPVPPAVFIPFDGGKKQDSVDLSNRKWLRLFDIENDGCDVGD